jgi:GH15 family glucan-1,4-alpha-glucosidase
LSSERDAYFGWLCDVLERDGPSKLQAHYALDGGTGHGHQTRPFPLGILGQLAIAIDEYRLLTGAIPPRAARALSELAEVAGQAWRRPNQDPLEPPSRPEHYVSSKALCWAALDRACRLLPKAAVQPRWRRERDILLQTILAQGFDERAGTFVRSFSSHEVGVGPLFIPLVGLLPPEDPRVGGTLDAISSQLAASALNPRSTLLLASALARCGRIEQASVLFARICSHASPLGLLAEELDGSELSGAFPSAAVHAGLVCAALDIHAAMRDSHLIHAKKRTA